MKHLMTILMVISILVTSSEVNAREPFRNAAQWAKDKVVVYDYTPYEAINRQMVSELNALPGRTDFIHQDMEVTDCAHVKPQKGAVVMCVTDLFANSKRANRLGVSRFPVYIRGKGKKQTRTITWAKVMLHQPDQRMQNNDGATKTIYHEAMHWAFNMSDPKDNIQSDPDSACWGVRTSFGPTDEAFARYAAQK